ncbi:unnamed protein product [Rotaria socialis]|uniref:TIR domain-containing protein n=2 Tax=Rotaria socialis TaxID=392032 RepID=A0A818DPT1_9BILA|nr:unnamed protein product [Rotaria socialis]CAF3319202.1 unnamed protein product [Rotaria socialis]CAF3355368.1 unnamed protein product [Rotaria socialis]CAF3450242.1 unnamed protein product [Rotaria socialis]CAF3524126.1 unnamed protein product [Rotaria socialis]
MDNNFEQLVSALPLSSSFTFGISEITYILEKQNIDLSSSFIFESFQSLVRLECWAWKVLSKDSYQWINQPNYLTLFHTLALFNKNLIFNYDNIKDGMKASLLIPDTIDQINDIFEQINRDKDDNDPFISIASVWFDNLALFVHENPEFDTSPVICHINQFIGQNYLMTEQYTFYLAQLQKPKLPQSIFTAKQLFYIKTCSFCLSSYLTATAQHFLYTAEDILHYVGNDFVQIIEIHSHIIDMWSEQFLTCITHLIGFIAACCWWGGEKQKQINRLFHSEQIIYSYINSLIRIISYKPFYSHIKAQSSNDDTQLIDFCLFSLQTLAQNQDLIWFFRSKISVPETLSTIAELSIHDKICLRAYIILGEILCNERLKDLKIADNLSLFFYDMLEHAWRHPSKNYKQIPIFHLLRGFLTLSKIDAIQQKTADLDKIPLFIEICDEYPITFDILWALSFNSDIQNKLRSNTAFMAKLVHLAKQCDNEQMRKMTHGILWNLESSHQDRAMSEFSEEKQFDIMISYSHKEKVLCKQIYDELTKAGYRIWIDFDQMHGNVMDAMAQAIEQSNVIIICMSEQYRRSNYCRAEAHYAFQRQLKIVPILLQKHYKPDGWLSFLIGQLLYVDFTKHEFVRAMKLLMKELQTEQIPEILMTAFHSSSSTDSVFSGKEEIPLKGPLSVSIIFPKNMLDWTRKNVHDWLMENNLIQMSQLLVDCNGSSLLYLSDFIKSGETKQVLNLLQEESLRRTNEGLSLVELSYFQSLMDQQRSALGSKVSRRSLRNTNRGKKLISSCCQII